MSFNPRITDFLSQNSCWIDGQIQELDPYLIQERKLFLDKNPDLSCQVSKVFDQ